MPHPACYVLGERQEGPTERPGTGSLRLKHLWLDAGYQGRSERWAEEFWV